MKRIICILLAVFCLFCFTGCKDGKCDDCGTKENVSVYEKKDGDQVEYCPECYIKAVSNGILGGLLG